MRTLCIRDLHYFQTFRNSCLFCTFWFFRNLNSADSHHASYDERCSNHHFKHCAQCVYEQCFQSFRNCCFFCTFWLLRNLYSGDAHHPNYGKHSLMIISNIAQTVSDFKHFTSFPNCNLFWTFFLFRNFYSADAHHANNGEHCSSPHFRYCTHWVDEIYSVFTHFEIAVSFPHLR